MVAFKTSYGQMFSFVDILNVKNYVEIMRFSCLANFLCVLIYTYWSCDDCVLGVYVFLIHSTFFWRFQIISWFLRNPVAIIDTPGFNQTKRKLNSAAFYALQKKVLKKKICSFFLELMWCEICISFFFVAFILVLFSSIFQLYFRLLFCVFDVSVLSSSPADRTDFFSTLF